MKVIVGVFCLDSMEMMEEVRECPHPVMTPSVTSVTPLTSSAPVTSGWPQCPVTSSTKREREVMGQYRFDLQHSGGRQSSFHLTTRRKGKCSLRRCISGLTELESRGFKEVILKKVNEEETRGKAHNEVVSILMQHLYSTTADVTRLTLTMEGTDRYKRKHRLEVTIEVDFIDEDGPSIGDKIRAVYHIFVRVIDHVITVPDVTDVTYKDCRVVRVRHGALVEHYMKVGADSRLCMVNNISDKDGLFKCYEFSGHDQTDAGGRKADGGRGRRCRGGGCGGGDGDRWPTLCVLQDLRSRRFVQVNALTSRLTTDPDSNHPLKKDITEITKPDGRFFVLIETDQREGKYCLTPLILRDYYLRFDAVDGLKLEKLEEPPFCTPLTKRIYDFEIVNVRIRSKPVTP